MYHSVLTLLKAQTFTQSMRSGVFIMVFIKFTLNFLHPQNIDHSIDVSFFLSFYSVKDVKLVQFLLEHPS